MLLSDNQIDLIKKCENRLEFYSLGQELQSDLMWLAQNRYCETLHGLAGTVYRLTPKGRAYLSSLENQAKRKQKKRAKNAPSAEKNTVRT